MSDASNRARPWTPHRIERLRPWIAGVSSVLLHIALLWLAMLSPPITVSTPQGTAAGSTVQAVFIDGTPPPPTDAAPETDAAPPAASRIQPPPVADAEDPVLPPATRTAESRTPPRIPRPVQARETPAPPTSTPRPSRVWGQPPGMLQEEHAPVHAGTARSPSIEPGRRYDAASSEAQLEAGGYQVVYDLSSETRLRAWRDEGMTEVFIPLPGTRQLMACPLETALRRGSGPCRLVEPNDPELADIGDARKVLRMHQVYRRGELVWRGPGPYR